MCTSIPSGPLWITANHLNNVNPGLLSQSAYGKHLCLTGDQRAVFQTKTKKCHLLFQAAH